jgi:hypothetical protein
MSDLDHCHEEGKWLKISRLILIIFNLLFAVSAVVIFFDYVLVKNITTFKTYLFITLVSIVFISLSNVLFMFFKCKREIIARVLLRVGILFAVCYVGYAFYSLIVLGNRLKILHDVGNAAYLGQLFAIFCCPMNMQYQLYIIRICRPEIKSQYNLMRWPVDRNNRDE